MCVSFLLADTFTCQGIGACLRNGVNAVIAGGACQQEDACNDNTGLIDGVGTCVTIDSPSSECRFNSGNITGGACTGSASCRSNSGVVDDGACSGEEACRSNQGLITGSGACSGINACFRNRGMIIENACSGDNSCEEVPSCVTLSSDICSADNSCQWPEDYDDSCCGTSVDCCGLVGLSNNDGFCIDTSLPGIDPMEPEIEPEIEP